MRRPLFIVPALLLGVLAFGAAQAFAQAATVVMRNGDRVRADVVDMGANFTFRINGSDQQIPINDVAVIDFTGDGRNLPSDEVNRANDASGNGFVVLKNGETFNGRLQDLHGAPLQAAFAGGRDVPLSDVSRIYLGSVNNIPDIVSTSGQTSSDRQSLAPARARTVTVPANVQWTNTGITVRRGQPVRFEPSGDARLSTSADDVANAAGARNGRMAAGAPIPSIPAGALIGRVDNGQPFSIGDTTQEFRMPANGRLFLGINDDHVEDNSGNYVVRVWQP